MNNTKPPAAKNKKNTTVMTRERIELPTVGWFNIHFHHFFWMILDWNPMLYQLS